jgi:Rps23 Pro-64 3,4-dihydroxylase Tpa1-like proline 4-hydroxylase
VNKLEAIELFTTEGWTKVDTERALKEINFKTNPDELTIRKIISQFAGSELVNRQRLQAAQKNLVTKKNKELEKYRNSPSQGNGDIDKKIQNLLARNTSLEVQVKKLISEKAELFQANEGLKKDNKALKNLVDEIKLKMAISTKQILKYEDSEIRQALVKFFSWTLG